MALTPGTRLGPYEITAQIGAGGMGQVYRTRDSKLQRDVAIKVLPDAFAQDPERLARFEREARTLAALNHPNIAQIYDLETSGGITALVMELVEGEDLSQRIARGAIPIDESLPIAKQIAEALEAAHEQGIIHRDLKPANIKVRADGTVKVLDFGLAKITEGVGQVPRSGPAGSKEPDPAHVAISQAPTITTPAMMTGVGVILGTAAYMSPEQARGKAVDKRADIWAFGCVVYEMLSGQRPFDGEDIAETLGAVIHKEPAWSRLPTATPSAVLTVLQRCLQKDPKQRLRDIGDVRLALEGAFETDVGRVPRLVGRSLGEGGSGPADGAGSSGVRDADPAYVRPMGRHVALVGAAALLAGLIIAGATVWIATRPAAPAVVRTTIATSGSTALVPNVGDRNVTITPDGSRIVYRGANQLLVRALNQFEPTVLGGLGSPRGVFISPDGQWVGFFDGTGQLKKVAITGGPPVTIATDFGADGPRGATWGADGTIIFATATRTTGLQRVSAAGGDVTVLTRPDRARGETDHLWPEFLPGGQGVLFTIVPVSGGLENAQVAVLDLATGVFEVVVRGGHHAHYLPTGHLVYGAGETLRAVAFDLDRLQSVGNPVPVLDGVFTAGEGAVNAVVAANGTLVYVPPGSLGAGLRSLVWTTRAGGEEPVPAPPREYESLQLSPDGARAVIQVNDKGIGDIWVWDFARQTLTRLTFDAANDYDPAWTPDGRRVVFSRSGTLFWRAADGTGAEEQLTTSGGMLPTSFSPDGKQLIVWQNGGIKLLTMDGKRQVAPLVETMFNEGRAYLSPDGRWLAYQSDESGQSQVYVQPFPDLSAGRWQVSPTGGAEPAWSRNGRELFYLNGEGALVTIPIQTQPAFSAGRPTKLFDAPYFPVTGTRRYDVTADGQRFLFIKDAADQAALSAAPSLVVIQNWQEELKRLVPTN